MLIMKLQLRWLQPPLHFMPRRSTGTSLYPNCEKAYGRSFQPRKSPIPKHHAAATSGRDFA